MTTLEKKMYSDLNGIARRAKEQFSNLLSPANDSNKLMQRLENIRELLHSLLLGTNEFDVANLRIGNAKRYLESGEEGAAKYEIRLLVGGLQSQPALKSAIELD